MTQKVWDREFCKHEHTTINGELEKCDMCGKNYCIVCEQWRDEQDMRGDICYSCDADALSYALEN
jgi:hypothetical protein